MSNGFEALAPLADKLKTQALRQEAEREAKQKASEHIARETNVFLDVMNQTGVKAMAGVRIKPRIEEKDIDFAAAMKKAGVKPLGDETRAQHRKVRRPIPVQTIADNKRVLEESMKAKTVKAFGAQASDRTCRAICDAGAGRCAPKLICTA